MTVQNALQYISCAMPSIPSVCMVETVGNEARHGEEVKIGVKKKASFYLFVFFFI